MQEDVFALKGNICYSKTMNELHTLEGGYVVCKDGRSQGVFKILPDEFSGIPVQNYKDALIIPGLVDLHTHAPQFICRALGHDRELLEWLESTAFPQEAKYKNTEYAEEAYKLFVQDIVSGPNTRIIMFATLHVPATIVLMDLLEQSGLVAYVGKVNMDRNAPDYLCESSAESSADATIDWLEITSGRYRNVYPIITPRFIPSCTNELLEKLDTIRTKYNVPVQSHLSESLSEIDWVRQLHPDCSCYGHAYHKYGLLETGGKSIMAHCVHCSEEELELLKKQEVFIAHCPQSNINISSGLVPVRKYIDMGLNIGLGSDIAGGYTSSIFRAMADSIQMSKMLQCSGKYDLKPLTLEEAFYFATIGGGAFFGKVGSFDAGYVFDAVVIDDSPYHRLIELSITERLERAMYLSDANHIVKKYVKGREINYEN